MPSEASLQSHADQMELFREEQVRREAVQVGRGDQISTRAGVLIGSAAITSALRTADLSGVAAQIAAAAGLVAVVFGLVALLPTRVQFVDLSAAWPKIWKAASKEAATFYLIDRSAAALRMRNRSNLQRAWVIRLGFLSLAVSVVSSAINTLL